MFSQTSWRIRNWNSDTVSGDIGIGLGGGSLQIDLSHASRSHNLNCIGVHGSLGIGSPISVPAGSLGFDPSSRTQGGTLYKNDLAISGDLGFDDLRTSYIFVQGIEVVILDEGQVGYLVIFASGLATLSTFLGGGSLLSEALAVVTCRAVTFLSASTAGLPNTGLAGYRYMVIGGN